MSYGGGGGVGGGPGSAMMESYHMLELIGVSHTGPIVPSNKISCWSKLTGSVTNGLILKDVSFELHSGEVMAILGSKGSGKKALIDVVGHRISDIGETKGQILLNDVPLTLRLFQEQCGYVSRRTEYIDGLTVRQMLYYQAKMTLKTNNSIKRARMKQVLADLALTSVQNRKVDTLNISESRRLAIALQLIRDPLLLILDDPCSDLDPLNTYFVVSILSNHAKKYGRVVMLTMDKPRSDIFPFLDRVTYLCLGDVVYTGSTRMMMDYFRSIGFSCPELENPLMYYLCLSTVDRRSRDRFIESSAQIAALVDKFKGEGHEYRKYSPVSSVPMAPPSIPLTAYGRASGFSIFCALIGRQLSSIMTVGSIFKRLLLLPLFCALLYLFIFPKLELQQQAFQTRSGLLFNVLAGTSLLSAVITAQGFRSHRNRFYEESSRYMLYRGPLFVFTNALTSIPFSLMTIWLAGSTIYWAAYMRTDDYWLERWTIFCGLLWAIYTFSEQHTIAIMCFVKSSFAATVTSMTLLMVYLVLGSGSLRSMLATQEATWLKYVNYANPFYYAGWTLHFNEFYNNADLDRTPSLSDTGMLLPCPANVIAGRCLYVNGTHFLQQRFTEGTNWPEWSINFWRNFSLTFVFVASSYALNMIVYIVPLPASLKAKFRD
ncbi:ATP-binding cassette sub-family G member 5 [Halotydeus destructor]|nr:ATP-binding cassette sub-family G member 5 [Halotydeus destructor]